MLSQKGYASLNDKLQYAFVSSFPWIRLEVHLSICIFFIECVDAQYKEHLTGLMLVLSYCAT